MTWAQALLLCIGIAFIIGLLRAAKVLGENPYQRERMHRDLGVHFSSDTPWIERETRTNLRGITPSGSLRPTLLALTILLVTFASVLLWLY